MRAIVYDAGALIGADRRQPQMMRFHDRANREGLVPIVPANVLAQVWRDGRQVTLGRLLVGCDIETLDEERARHIGALAKESGVSDVVDLSVVEAARRHNAIVVTSDPQDISRIASAAGINLRIVAV